MTLLSLRRPSFAPLLARGGVFAKDVIQYAPFAFGLAALLLVYPAYRAAMAAAGVEGASRVHGDDLGRMLTAFLLGTTWGLGLVCSCDEEESETRYFLGRLPIGPGRLLLGKIGAVALSTIVTFVVLVPVMWFLAHGVPYTSETGAWVFRGRPLGFLEFLTGSVLPTRGGEIAGLLLILTTAALTGMLGGALFVRQALAAMAFSGGATLLVAMLANSVDSLLRSSLAAGTAQPSFFSIWYAGAAIHLAWIVFVLRRLHVRFATRGEAEEPAGLREVTAATRGPGRLARVLGGWANAAPIALRPARHMLSAPFGAAVLLTVLGIGWHAWLPADSRVNQDGHYLNVPVLVLVLSVVGSVLGVGVLHRTERQRALHFLYALPVSPVRLLWQRLALLPPAAAALIGVACLAGILGTIDGLINGFHFGANGVDVTFTLVALDALVALVAAMTLGLLVRCFVRSYLLAVIATLPVAALWTIVFVAASVSFYPGDRTTLALGPGFFWPAFVALAMPVAALHLAIAGSPLLTVGEGRRAFAMIPSLAFVMVWGIVLMTLAPLDLYIALRY